MTELNIKGEVVAIYCRVHRKGSRSRGWCIRHPEIASLNGKLFFCGTPCFPGGHWSNDKRCRVALDDVSAYVEFDTYDQFLADAPKKRRKWRWLPGSA